jgi:pimeloyl-ACP methyl ester carboxylesterase
MHLFCGNVLSRVRALLPGCRAASRLLLCCIVVLAVGCSTITVRPVDLSRRAESFDRNALTSDRPSERTLAFLKQRDLEAFWRSDPVGLITMLDAQRRDDPYGDTLFALMELCHLEAARSKGVPEDAAVRHLSCALYAYLYLLNLKGDPNANLYHPYSRMAAQFYNHSLARYLVHARETGLRYEQGRKLSVLCGSIVLDRRQSDLSWKPEEFAGFKLAYEYEVSGLDTKNVNPGLGVPLALIRKQPPPQQDGRPEDRFLPTIEQTYAATVFLRIKPEPDSGDTFLADLELYDPMRTDSLRLGDVSVPLETDLTTPLAYMIANAPSPQGIAGLMDPGAMAAQQGLYMLQPYQPDKIPVIFVHGLMSSPQTWVSMLNGLMGDPVLRRRYQFWFFKYPTGNPVLYSAATLRDSIRRVRMTFDPEGRDAQFNKMVIVSHSMGGLLSKTMAESSGTGLWDMFSGIGFEEIDITPDERDFLARIFFFEPQPAVSRVVFIATPHRGAGMAMGTIGRIGRALVTLPATLLKTTTGVLAQLAQKHPAHASKALVQLDAMPTGIDSLSPKNPALAYLVNAKIQVPYHSIIGNEREAKPGGTDGVVAYESSHLDGAESELVVHSGHNAQEHPLAIREVRRILLEHLGDDAPGRTAAQP